MRHQKSSTSSSSSSFNTASRAETLLSKASAFHAGHMLSGWRSAASALALLIASPALAGPEGAQVVRGNVQIERNGNQTVIRAGDRSIINYRNFNIGANESVQFIQPGSQSRVLNRINSAAPTRIDGSLSANGRVYIVNPAGVVFGQGSVVNVSGLFAAAGNISDRDFVNGVDRVTGMSGSVVNLGDMRGQSIVLAGSSVANMGNIVAPEGTVAMAAGQDMVISQRDGAMHVRVNGQASGDANNAAVTNTGTIDTTSTRGASSGKVIMAAGDVYGLAINTTGTVRGRSVEVQGQGTGDVVVGGTIDVSDSNVTGPAGVRILRDEKRSTIGKSAIVQQAMTPKERKALEASKTGGNVDIVGQRIALYNSTINASGVDGGGLVRVGGDVQGARINGDFANAAVTSVNSGTTITTDATQRGNGGTVVIWSDDTTRSFAAISAKGAQAGSGGFIETSSKGHLSVDGSRIDASGGDTGNAGTWLLDPRNVVINNTGPTTGDFDALSPDVFTPNQDDSVVLASDITSRLDAGTSVTITTGSTGTQDGDIRVENDVLSTGTDATLRLQAANSIFVNNGVSIGATGGGSIGIQLIANAADANDPDGNAGAIVLGAGSSLTSGGADITLAGGTVSSFTSQPGTTGYDTLLRAAAARGTAANPDGITINNASINAGAGTVSIRGVGRNDVTGAAGVVITNDSSIIGATVRIDGLGGSFAGGAGGDANNGVDISGVNTVIRTQGGPLRVFGTGGTTESGADVVGIRLAGGTIEALSNSSLFLIGRSGSGDGARNHGVSVETGSITTGGSGALQITGAATGAGDLSHGFVMTDGTVSSAAGSLTDPALRIVGSGSTGGGSAGILVSGVTTNITSSNKRIELEGTGVGSLASHGVQLDGGVNVSGRGVTISGLSSNATAIAFTSGTSNVSANAGDLTLRGDSMNIGTGNFSGAGVFSVENRNAGTTIGIGDSAAGTLAISTLEFNTIINSSGFTGVSFGSSSAGLMTTDAIDFGTFSGTNIRFVGTSFATGGIVGTPSHVLALRFNNPTSGSGMVTQTGEIVIGNLKLFGNSQYTLTNALNDVDLFAGDVGGSAAGAYYDADGINIASIDVTNGLTTRGNFEVRSLTDTLGNSGFINAAAGELILAAAEVDLGNNVSGAGSLVLQPLSSSVDVRVGDSSDSGAGVFDILSSELAFVQDGLGLLTIGRNDSSGTMNFAGPLTLNHATRFRMGPSGGTGIINIGQAITTTGAEDALTFRANTLNLSNNITTSGATVLLAGNTRLNSNITIDTSSSAPIGGNITFNGPIDADAVGNDRVLTLNAGTAGNVTFNGVVGSAERLQSIAVTAAATNINGGVRTQLGQDYATVVNLAGDLSSNAGDVTFQQTLNVTADSNITSSGNAGDDVTFQQGINSTVAGADLTVNAGLGNISLQGTNTLGRQTYNGAQVTLNQNVTGAELVFGGPVILEENITVAGTTGVSFQGTVNSAATELRTLTINSPATTFLGDVGTATDGLLGSLTTDAGTMSIGASLIRTSGDIDIADNITLTGNNTIASTTGKVLLRGSVNSDGTSRAFIANSVTGVSLLGGAGNTSPLLSLATSATGPGAGTTIGGIIETTTALNFTTPILLASATTVRGPGVTFSGTVDSASSTTLADLTVVASGQAVAFNGAVGGTTRLQTMNITGQSISLGNVATDGNQLYTGTTRTNGTIEGGNAATITFASNVLLTGNTTVRTTSTSAESDILFQGTVNSEGSAKDLTIDSAAGDVVFAQEVGTSTTANEFAVANLNITGNSVTMRNTRTTGRQLISGATFLNGNLTSTGTGDISIAGATQLLADTIITTTNGGVIFFGTVDSDSTTRALTVNTGGSGVTRFAGAVGSTNQLSSLTTNADGSTLLSTSQIRTSGDQLFNDAVTLGANVTLNGSDVLFGSTLNSDATNTPRNLTINTAANATTSSDTGETTFQGIVGGLRRLGSITTNGDGTTLIANNISTTRRMDFGDAVLLAGNNITLDAGATGITFRGTVNADTTVTDPTLTLLSTSTGDVDSASFRFGGNVGTSRRLGGLNLGANRSNAVASNIVFTDALDQQGRITASGVTSTDAFTVTTAAGGFNVATGHKIVSFGNLTINSTGAVTLNDATVLGNFSVTGSAINIRARNGAQIQNRSRQLIRDVGTDFVASGAINFSRTPTVIGSGIVPTFNPGNGQIDPELSGFTFRTPARPIRASDFTDSTNTQLLLPLDLKADGASRTNITTAINMPWPPVNGPGAVPPALPETDAFAALAELGISTRGRTTAEVVEGLSGRNFDDRLPATGLAESGVRADQMSEQSANRAINAYRALIYGPLTDEEGNTLYDEQGQVRVGDRTPHIRAILEDSWAKYSKKSNKPSGEGWRAYLESQGTTGTPEETLALEYLNQGREALRAVANLGLPNEQASIPRHKIIQAIMPKNGPTEKEFLKAVEGVWQFSSR